MLKLLTEFFTKKVKKNYKFFENLETILLSLTLKCEKIFRYQQKNVEKILSFKKFLLI